MPSDLIIDVNETDFEYEVLSYSQNVPVVVDFWATWCRPCKVLSPMLESMTQEAGGAFRLARVDVDQNPNLALRYGVRSIPAVKVFSGGQVAGEFTGVIPEEKLREFLGKITPPSAQQLMQEKADSMLALHEWVQAEKTYRELLEQNAASPESAVRAGQDAVDAEQEQRSPGHLAEFPRSAGCWLPPSSWALRRRRGGAGQRRTAQGKGAGRGLRQGDPPGQPRQPAGGAGRSVGHLAPG